jgi:hypothetical protein
MTSSIHAGGHNQAAHRETESEAESVSRVAIVAVGNGAFDNDDFLIVPPRELIDAAPSKKKRK